MVNIKQSLHDIYRKLKIIIIKIEKNVRDYFSAKGSDIYTRFVRRMFFFFVMACLLAGLVSGITLAISSIARPLTKVPDVKGLNVVDASLQIQDKGLSVEIDSKFDPGHEKFSVIEQFPKNGITVKKGRTVTLLVSMGKDVYITPSLTGMKREDAEKLLLQLGIGYEITVIQSSDFEINTIISQDIPAKTEVDRNQKLNIVVNSDVSKNEFRLSDYTKQSLDMVAKTLIAGSIQPIIEKVPTKVEEEDGIVLSQSISGGTVVAKNSDIRLQVGVYGENDKDRDSYNYYVFSYFLNTLDTSGTNSEADNQASVKITLSDEQKQQDEIYNQNASYGDYIIVSFKAYGKAKLNLFINNNFVKEIPYE
jgi:serine/threonine-protein kinase